MSYYERDPEGKLVPVSDVPIEAIQLMERVDDDAIVHRMTTGIASTAFIYRYPIQTKQGVKEIIGISADGADEIATMRRNIEVLPDARVDKDSDPDYIYGMVRVKDIANNVTLLGVGRQCKYQIGTGNIPDHDRIDEHAFVKAITKATRNGILHLTSEEIIIGIINAFDKSGKSKQFKPPSVEVEAEKPKATAVVAPPVPTPAPAPSPTVTAEIVAAQQERLKELRMQVHSRFERDLGVGVDKRKVMLKEKFGADSLLDLNEQQLRDCLLWIEEFIQQKTITPPAPAPPAAEGKATQITALGFENEAEQGILRGRLYHMLTDQNQLGLKPDEAKGFIAKKGYKSTSEMTKAVFLEIIKEVDGLIKTKQAPAPELPIDEPSF